MVASPPPVVLVVEDHAETRQLYEAMLSHAGFDVVCVANGLAALDKVREQPPDVVVTDLVVPGLSGLELLAELQRDERTRHIPVVAVTGYIQTDLLKRAGTSGFDAVLLKPFQPDTLVAALSSLCGRKHPGTAERS